MRRPSARYAASNIGNLRKSHLRVSITVLVGIVFALITLSDKNSGIDDAVRAQGPVLVTVFSDDFSTDPNTSGKWHIINRFAGDLDKEVVWDPDAKTAFLTKASDAKAGVMVADYQLTSKIWEATFRFRAGGGEDPLFLGEGFVFHFYKNVDTYLTHRPMAAGALGFEGVPPGAPTCAQGVNCVPIEGYGIAFDAFPNGTPMIQVIKNRADPGAVLHQVGDTRVLDNAWHDARISFNDGMISVAIDGGNVLSYTITSMDYAFSGIAFSAATGLADQNHVIDNFVLRALPIPTPTPTPTPTPRTVPLFKQGILPIEGAGTPATPPWEADVFAHADLSSEKPWCGTTMAGCGCATTSLAMILAYHGVLRSPSGNMTDPGEVNSYLRAFPSGTTTPVPVTCKNINDGSTWLGYRSNGYSCDSVWWSKAARRYSEAAATKQAVLSQPTQPVVEYVENFNGSVDTTIAEGNPPIVKVDGNPTTQAIDDHWIVLAEPTGDTYSIRDPGAWPTERTTLEIYGGTPYAKRIMRLYATTTPTPNSMADADFSSSSRVLAPAQENTGRQFMSLIVSGPDHLLVTSPSHLRTGHDSSTDTDIVEIPRSQYFSDSETASGITGESNSRHISRQLDIPSALAGRYEVQIRTTTPREVYSVGVYATGSSGGDTDIDLTGLSGDDSIAKIILLYDPDAETPAGIMQQIDAASSVGGEAIGSISLSPSDDLHSDRVASSPTMHHAIPVEATGSPKGHSISWGYLALLAVIILIVTACTLRSAASGSQSNLNNS